MNGLASLKKFFDHKTTLLQNANLLLCGFCAHLYCFSIQIVQTIEKIVQMLITHGCCLSSFKAAFRKQTIKRAVRLSKQMSPEGNEKA